MVLFKSFEGGVSFFPQCEMKNHLKLFMKLSCVKIFSEKGQTFNPVLSKPPSALQKLQKAQNIKKIHKILPLQCNYIFENHIYANFTINI